MWDGALAGMLSDETKRQAIKHQTLADLVAVQNLVGSAQDREARNATRDREAAFRSKLSELVNPTHEQVRNLALQSGLITPKDVLSNDLGIYKADTAKDLAKARIDAAQLQHDRQYEVASRNAKTAEQRASLDAWYKQGKMAFDAARAQYGLPPDLIPSVAPFQAPEQAALQVPAPAKPATMPADVAAGVSQLNANVPQQIAAAAPIIARESMPNGGGAIPTSAVIQNPNGDHWDRLNPQPVSPATSLSAMANAPRAPAAVPVMPPEIQRLSRKDQAKWISDQTKLGDTNSPEREKSVEYWAGVMKAGGTLPPGLARNKEGAALVKDIMRKVATAGMTPEQMLASQAEFQGEKSAQRTLGTRIANIEMAATEAGNLMPIAIAASEKVDRTKYPTLNAVILAVERGTGDPNVVQLGVATNSLVNAYSRAISPSGTPTVSDKDHAREILANAYSKGQYAAAVNMMKQEIDAARKSPGQVKGAMRDQFTGKPQSSDGGWKDL